MKKLTKIPRTIKRAYPNVKTIIDAKRQVSIHVTENDCKNGEAMEPTECALAKAVKRQFHADVAIIGLGCSYIIKGDKATRFRTPERVQREIVSFDRSKDFASGDYKLSVMSPTARFGSGYNTSYKRKDRKDKRKRHDNAPVKHVKSARVRVLDIKA